MALFGGFGAQLFDDALSLRADSRRIGADLCKLEELPREREPEAQARARRRRDGPEVREACKKHGGFYLGSVGGPAARLAQDCIKKVELLEYPELGMEAIWRIEVVDFPAFIVVDDKGNDFYATLS